MATLTEEKYLESTTVLTAAETQQFDAVLDSEPEPPSGEMVEAFRGAAQNIKVDC